MRKLTKMELEAIGGGVCENMPLQECIEGFGGQVVKEANNMVAGLNQMGRNLGAWLYYTFNC